MNVVAQVFALIAAAVHVLIFVMESIRLPRDVKVQQSFRVAPEDVNAVRPWAFNQGFYNLFLAVGIVIGLIGIWSGGEGRMLVGFCCTFMVAAALVLVGTDRRMLKGALVQGVAPLLAAVFLAF